MKIAMWSGPRNLSTAMMYAFAARSDCAVVDEPFYAAYLKATGLVHPMQEEILRSQPLHADEVVQQCVGGAPHDKPVFYQKQMTHHMLKTFPLEWLSLLTNVFLIRHPARVVASYQQKRENPSLEDIGFERQFELFNYVKTMMGKPPIVIDSDDILAAPDASLRKLCAAVGIQYESQMLSWPAGGNTADGVWAPHWYGSVWKSTGLKASPSKPLPVLSGELATVCEQALPFYEQMAEFKLV